MIIVALLVKILICCHNITKNSSKYWENCQKYWAKNAEKIRNCQGKNSKYCEGCQKYWFKSAENIRNCLAENSKYWDFFCIGNFQLARISGTIFPRESLVRYSSRYWLKYIFCITEAEHGGSGTVSGEGSGKGSVEVEGVGFLIWRGELFLIWRLMKGRA